MAISLICWYIYSQMYYLNKHRDLKAFEALQKLKVGMDVDIICGQKFVKVSALSYCCGS